MHGLRPGKRLAPSTALAGPFRADEKAAGDGDKAVDQRVYEVLKDVINTGADLYNGVPSRGFRQRQENS